MPKKDRQTYTNATHTRAIVKLHIPDKETILFLPERTYQDIADINVDKVKRVGGLVSVNTTKTIGEPVGTFQFSFKKTSLLGVESLLKFIEDPEDLWVEILFQVEGEVIDTMLGLVDVLKESTIRNPDGARIETYTISGSDFGKVFTQTKMFANPYIENAMPNYLAILDLTGGIMVGSPASLNEALVNIWLKNPSMEPMQAWRLPASLGGRPFYEHLHLDFQAKGLEAGLAYDPNFFNMSRLAGATPLWDSMVEYSNPLLNELYVDLQLKPSINIAKQDREDNYYGQVTKRTKLFPGVILRERPFPTSRSVKAWSSLPIYTLEPEDIVSRDMAKGGPANRFNYFRFTLQGLKGGVFAQAAFMADTSIGGDAGEDTNLGKPGSGFVMHQQSVLDHGIRPYAGATRFLPYDYADIKKLGDSSDTAAGAQESEGYQTLQSISDVGANWLRKAHDWYCLAHLQLSGMINTSRVMPEIRIGTRVKENRNDGVIHYYVEGVSNSWTYGSTGSTSLTLTRGEYEGRNLLKELYKREFDTQVLNDDVLNLLDEAVGPLAVANIASDLLKDQTPESFDLTSQPAEIAANEPIQTAETKQAQELAKGNSNALAPKEPSKEFGEDAINEEDLIGTNWDDPDPLGGGGLL
jgi:hypothetical protein